VTASAAQASAFYAEAVREGSVWALRDDDVFPAPLNGEGQRATPFWSLRSRAERIAATASAYRGFSSVEIPLSEFHERWLPRLTEDGLRVGVNWSGARVRPDSVRG
jgi:hypothetical protein